MKANWPKVIEDLQKFSETLDIQGKISNLHISDNSVQLDESFGLALNGNATYSSMCAIILVGIFCQFH
jgi:hypothetical protein